MSNQKYSTDDKLKCLRLFLPLRNPNTPDKKKIDILNAISGVTKIFLDLVEKKEEILFSVLKTLRHLLQSENSIVRALSIRVLRRCCNARIIIEHLEKLNIHFLIVRILEQQKYNKLGCVETFKLIYQIIHSDPDLMPRSFVQSIVAISEHEDDPLRVTAIMTLAELSLFNTHLSAICGGILTICKAIIDPSHSQIQEFLVRVLLNLINSPKTKQYVSTNELNIILSPFMSVFEKSISKKKFLTCIASKRAIIYMCRDWGGLIFFARNPNGLKGILHTLKLPSRKINMLTIETLYSLFFLKMPLNDGEQIEINYNIPNLERTNSQSSYHHIWGDLDLILPLEQSPHHNLLDNYVAILLVAFMDVGLFQSLVDVGKVGSKKLSFYIANLLGELLHRSNRILPSRLFSSLQSLPSLFEIAASFSDSPFIRVRASRMLSELDKFARKKKSKISLDFHVYLLLSNINHQKSVKVKRGFKSNELPINVNQTLKIKHDKSIADQEFESRMKESKVISTEDYLKWNFKTISHLLNGPLNNIKYLDISIKNKFMKNYLNFLDPNSGQFCNISKTQKNLIYIGISVQLIGVLLNHSVGCNFLKNSSFIRSIHLALRMENEGTSTNNSGMKRLFTPTKISKTLTKEYFTLIGNMTNYKSGLDILLKSGILKSLQKTVETKGRGDLALPIIISLDYNLTTITRRFLSKVLHFGTKLIRLQATEHLKFLWRAGVNDFSDWAIKMLVWQLRDKDVTVAGAALDLLDECCTRSPKCLETLVSCRPEDLSKFGIKGKNLLITLLSMPKGFDHLKEIKYIDQKLIYWEKKGIIDYVKDLDHYLTSIYSYKKHNYNDNIKIPLPPHFFAELVKTEKGANILLERKLIPKWINFLSKIKFLKNASLEINNNLNDLGGDEIDTEIVKKEMKNKIENEVKIGGSDNVKNQENEINKGTGKVKRKGKGERKGGINKNEKEKEKEKEKETESKKRRKGVKNGKERAKKKDEFLFNSLKIRAIIWTIGSIASSKLGYKILKKYNPVKIISNFALNSNQMSVRGTCIYVMGLLSEIDEIRKKLNKYGWEYPTEKGHMIAIPTFENRAKFFSYNQDQYLGSYPKNLKQTINIDYSTLNTEKNNLIKNLKDIGNTINEDSSMKNLLELKSNHPELFLDPHLFYISYKMLEYYKFRFSIRKFFHFLFRDIFLTEKNLDNLHKDLFIDKKNETNNINIKNNQIGFDLSDLFENKSQNENMQNNAKKIENVTNNKTIQQKYSFERLKQLPLPDGVNPKNLIHFLKEDDFDRVLSCSKQDFLTLPKWSQMHKLKECGLL
ncbi:cytosolic regulator pianissimo [Anaeramoeba flamelloides]|uniref:Cytosolic regulator pianissimo n=1 Tax=Anaeramoeba flamelloides TaxID=1746091 RepID=A0ABQ8ZF25_9EUKA|nr:cytosolic regulator pianissimo [Anaeramoeba flamelloides]